MRNDFNFNRGLLTQILQLTNIERANYGEDETAADHQTKYTIS